jgi:16S rRNA (guanine527-N7)-methyltransferase
LIEILEESQRRGLLGPGPVESHIAHARGFALALRRFSPTPPPRALDLGAGGGVPGVVLLFEWEETDFIWLDSTQRSAAFLQLAKERLDGSDRVRVLQGRAEDLGRVSGLRGSLDVVVARSFGRPAVTAECGAPFLVRDGYLVVSDPPVESDARWDDGGLRKLGLEAVGRLSDGANYQVLRQVEVCPEEFPRRSGRPGKRPLF